MQDFFRIVLWPTRAVDQVSFEIFFADSEVLDAIVEFLRRLRRVDPVDQSVDLKNKINETLG